VPDTAPLRRPATTGELFRAFTSLALQGFGGVLPVAQRVLVERQRWLSRDDFLEMLSLAQVLPGPNIINLALMIGSRFFGWRGALAALGGILLAPLVVVLALAIVAQRLHDVPAVTGALHGMGIVASGLILATAVRLGGSLRNSPLGLGWCALFLVLSVLGVAWLRWPLAWVVLGLGVPGAALAWWKLGR
jgi:chromate transporter